MNGKAPKPLSFAAYAVSGSAALVPLPSSGNAFFNGLTRPPDRDSLGLVALQRLAQAESTVVNHPLLQLDSVHHRTRGSQHRASAAEMSRLT